MEEEIGNSVGVIQSEAQRDLLNVARGLPTFRQVPTDSLIRLLEGASVKRYPAGTQLFFEGELASHLYGIVDGMVELFAGSGDSERGILLLAKGDVFMPGAALFDEPYLHAARILRRTKLLEVDVRVLRAEAARTGELAMAIGRVLAGQFRMAVRSIIDLKTSAAAQRLAIILLRLVDQHDGAGLPRLPIAKRTLATRLGMTAETLSRTLQIVASNGLVVRGSSLLLRDRAKLEAFCGPSLDRGLHEFELGVSAL
ncbi:helix-turn-helix domain-containing protein [Novosphingobium sp. G106]|uniref:helix-turn-helix domain-containing protein n=1 Tax=Novosphingobium sp. G106 TaxID=2849500 RepID=UPI001C2D05C8|nr:helix-turn-helix domain-containing protein [Novosphingobium sp. G106]